MTVSKHLQGSAMLRGLALCFQSRSRVCRNTTWCSHNISLSSTISSVRHPLLLGGTSSSAYYRMSQPLKGQLSAHCGCKRIPQPELDRTKNIIRWRQIACSAATTEPHKWPVHHVLRNFSGGPYEFPLSLHFHLEIIITTCHTINTSHL
jgi:hypothetical protein